MIGKLLVTCALERSRSSLLHSVNENLTRFPGLTQDLTVFDNCSTYPGTVHELVKHYGSIYRADHNVGYWTAIDWWLNSGIVDHCDHLYVIESDMIHYVDRLAECAAALDAETLMGSVRLHEYNVSKRHLYDKDRPLPDSRRNLWQSHTNKVTGKPVSFVKASGDVWYSTFLTQLPALNRRTCMQEVFSVLRTMDQFDELDFQREYWKHYQMTGVLDGGMFNCDMNPYGSKAVTGSWTSEAELRQLGYAPTRKARIVPRSEYSVSKFG